MDDSELDRRLTAAGEAYKRNQNQGREADRQQQANQNQRVVQAEAGVQLWNDAGMENAIRSAASKVKWRISQLQFEANKIEPIPASLVPGRPPMQLPRMQVVAHGCPGQPELTIGVDENGMLAITDERGDTAVGPIENALPKIKVAILDFVDRLIRTP
jgi:hypothetical protein